MSGERRAVSPLEQMERWLAKAGLRVLRWEVLQVRPRAWRSYVVVAGKDGAGLILRFTARRLCFAAVDPWSEECASGTLFPLLRQERSLEEVEEILRHFGPTVQDSRKGSGAPRSPGGPGPPWWEFRMSVKWEAAVSVLKGE